MESVWKIKKCNVLAAESLHKMLKATKDASLTGISLPFCKLLVNKGYSDYLPCYNYLKPNMFSFHNPFLFCDMEKSIERMERALNNKEKIVIFGDYDADGVSGTAFTFRGLRRAGYDVDYFIPHRIENGYGLNMDALGQFVGKYTLMVTVDTGIKSVAEIEFLKQNGIDVILTDHHEPGDVIPDAVAILNPKVDGSGYPFSGLCGAGVAFKFLTALYTKLQLDLNSLYQDLDIVALGTVADVMPLIDENRIIVKYGLACANKNPKPAFKAMHEDAELKGEFTCKDLGWVIGPRINAPGRIDSAELSFKLLIEEDLTKAREYAKECGVVNKERIEHTKLYSAEQIEFLNNTDEKRRDYGVVVTGDFHPGIAGLIAANVLEAFYRPTIALSEYDDETYKGSARSIPGVHILNAITKCDDLLLRYGGHEQAAGLSIKKCNLQAFIERFREVVKNSYDDSVFIPTKQIDLELGFDEISEDFIDCLQKLEPVGEANSKPVFFAKDVEVLGYKFVGSDKNTLQLVLKQNGVIIDAVGFKMSSSYANLGLPKKVDLIFSPEINVFNDRKSIKLKLNDIRIAQV